MQTICKVPEVNVLECNSDEKNKDWKLTNKFEFDPLGIINTRTFHSKNIVAKKYYEVSCLFLEKNYRKLQNSYVILQ